MASIYESALSKSLLVLAMAGALAACGGSDNSSNNGKEDEDHDHEHAGGRLIYSVSNASGLKMYDQTVDEADAFADIGGVTTSQAGASLVLAKNGLTAAMLDNGAVSIVDAGLEHLADEDGHTHDVEATATTLTSGITQVLATHEYFSAFDGSGSTVIDAEDGSAVTAPSSDAYPTLALAGGHFLTFNSIDGAVELKVVEADGESLETPVTLNCGSGGITTSAQTEHLTQVLCGNGTLLTLIAEEGETDTAFYTDSDAESGFDNLTATFSENDVIAAWNSETGVMSLTKAHGDHPHSTDVSENISSASIISVAAPSDHETEVIGILGGDGVFTALFYTAEDHSVEFASKDTFSIGSELTWSADDAVLAGSTAFLVVNTEANELYYIDAHDGSDYHVHGSAMSNEDLSSVASAVFAHSMEEHDHEGEDHEEEHNHAE